MTRICVVVAAEMTARVFLLDQMRALSKVYRVSLVANTADPEFLHRCGIDAETIPVRIVRNVSPIDDVRALLRLWRLFMSNRYVAVHSVTPKAGLLAMLAGMASGTPVRIHTFTGQVWATRSGWSRQVLKRVDQLTAWLATRVLADSDSQMRFLIAQGVVEGRKISVLGSGSISGVDLARFRPNPDKRAMVRKELDLPEAAVVFLFLGRVTRDKGVLDLAGAFADVATRIANAFLLVVGPDEESLADEVLNRAGAFVHRVRVLGHTDSPESIMAAGDVYCLPSYREGFGSSVIEAAAVGLPAIASNIYGLADSVQVGVTGLLHAPKDVAGIADAMTRLATDVMLRLELGANARARARREFDQNRVTGEVLRLYENEVATRGPR